MKFKFLFLIILIGFLSSCHKDIVDEDQMTEENNFPTIPFVYQEIEGSVVGFVYDTENNPVSGASIETYSASTTTNAYGVFVFNDINLDVQGTLIQIKKSGYINTSDLIFPSETGTAFSRTLILKPNSTNSFESQEGGQFDVDGSSVFFFADSYSTVGSSDYSGIVSATIDHLSPEEVDFGAKMNGGFRGLDRSLDENVEVDRVLGSFGVIKTGLRGSNGEQLRLNEGASFRMLLPIPEKLLVEATESIQVWRYDESKGLWVDGGIAVKIGNTYEAMVTEVGSWMFADAYDLTQYCSRLVNTAGFPIANVAFNVFVENRICATGISDELGFICSKLPRGEELQVRFFNPFCGEEFDQITIGPFDGQATPEDIGLNVEEESKSGKVLCDGQPVEGAVIIVEKEDYKSFYVSDQEGSFNIPVSMILCSELSEYKIYAINENQEDLSPILMLSQDNVAEIRLDVCMGECNIEAVFEFYREDWCIAGNYDSAEITISGGSGDYSYLWSDGSLGSSNSSLINGTDLCVTIVDQSDGCTLTHCESIEAYQTITIDEIKASNLSCQFDSGIIDLSIMNGRGEYTYQWEGPNGFSSTEPELNGLRPGEYTVTVSDVENCQVEGTVEMFDVTLPIEAVITEDCLERIIRIEEDNGFGPFDYEWSNGAPNFGELVVTSNGLYEVTVTDANGCSRFKSWDITLSEVFIDNQYSCDGYQLRFPATSNDNEYYYIKEGTSEKIILSELNGWVFIPTLDSGYSFTYGASDVNTQCGIEVIIELPEFYGLSIESVNNTSCDGCQDGSIIVMMDFMADCTSGCTPGEVMVLDQQLEEVTNLNNADELSAGEYYVIVMSEDGSCMIAHEIVIVE